MNTWRELPPGRVWVKVWDLPSALAALELLRTQNTGPVLEDPNTDQV